MKGSATYAVASTGWNAIIYFFGKNRMNSDKHGFIVYLCEAHHRGTYGVHGREGSFLDLKLKRECQAKFEEKHTRQEFMNIIGCNYIQEGKL